jgi:hypothetical protein
MIKPGTQDEVEGKLHDVKGKRRKQRENLSTILTWKPTARRKRSPGKSKIKSDR